MINITAEGTFSKVDGDILYASEANNFANQSYTFVGSTGTTTSASMVDLTGTVTIPANTLKNNFLIKINYYQAGGGATEQMGVKVVNGANNLTLDLNVVSAGNLRGTYELYSYNNSSGTTWNCYADLTMLGQRGSTDAFAARNGSLNIDTASSLVITFRGLTSNAGLPCGPINYRVQILQKL